MESFFINYRFWVQFRVDPWPILSLSLSFKTLVHMTTRQSPKPLPKGAFLNDVHISTNTSLEVFQVAPPRRYSNNNIHQGIHSKEKGQDMRKSSLKMQYKNKKCPCSGPQRLSSRHISPIRNVHISTEFNLHIQKNSHKVIPKRNDSIIWSIKENWTPYNI